MRLRDIFGCDRPKPPKIIISFWGRPLTTYGCLIYHLCRILSSLFISRAGPGKCCLEAYTRRRRNKYGPEKHAPRPRPPEPADVVVCRRGGGRMSGIGSANITEKIEKLHEVHMLTKVRIDAPTAWMNNTP